MKRLYFPLIFFLFTFCIQAQQQMKSEIDSLQRFTADSLYSLAVSNQYKNPIQAKTYALAYYDRIKNQSDVKKIYNAAFLKAEIYSVLGQKDSAHIFVDESIEKSLEAKDEDHYYNSLRLKGNIYYDTDLYGEAGAIFAELNKLVEKSNDIKKIADIRHSMALLKKEIGQTKQAIELAKENWELYRQGVLDKNEQPTKYINTLLSLSNIYLNLAGTYKNEKVHYLDSAEVYNDTGLKESLLSKDFEGHSIFLTMRGLIDQKRGNHEEASKSYKEAESQIKKLGFHNQLSLLYQFQGKNYFLKNDIDNAIHYLLKVDSIVSKKHTNTPSVKETYFLLAKSYGKKNNIKKVLQFYKIFEEKVAEKEALVSKTSQYLYEEYDLEKFKSEIESLENQSEEAQFTSKILIYICLLLVGVSLMGFWYYKKREQTLKKRFNSVLKELAASEKIKNNSKEKNSQTYIITDENIKKILEGLEKFENKELFLQKKCTLNYVAKKINTNSTYLSKTLQSHKQKKFVQYITDLRLNYALQRLKNDTKFRTYDIKSIAAELGFNTAESFSKAFKKRTGIYPSFYIKNLNKLKEEEVNI